MDKPYSAPQGRFLPTLILALFIVGLLYTAFLAVQKWTLGREIVRNEAQMTQVQADLEALREGSIQELFLAQNMVDRVKGSAVLWSTVLKKIQSLTPVTVFFSSYSFNESGNLQLSGLGSDYKAVSDLLDALTEAPEFQGVFVPSVTLGQTGDGQSVASFSLEMQFTPLE
jgi:hypothetical protein